MSADLFFAHGDRVPGRFDKCARVHIGKGRLAIRRIYYKFRNSVDGSEVGAMDGRRICLGSVALPHQGPCGRCSVFVCHAQNLPLMPLELFHERR